MVNEENVTEIANMYSKMSLIELLVEENLMTKFLHSRTPDAVRKELQKILRLEIEERLR